MSVFDDADQIESLIEESGGVEVVYGAVETWGHLDTIDLHAVGGEGEGVIGTQRSVLVATGKIGTVTMDSEITVGGTSFQVRDHAREDDGATTRILLRDA